MAKAIRICSIEECGNPHYGRSWCQKHYVRWYRHGSPDISFLEYLTPDERVARSKPGKGGCIIWTGNVNRGGYGTLSVDRQTVLAHRYVWSKENGAPPPGMEVNHICWNRLCCNIEHLELVEKNENGSYRSGAQSNSSTGVRNVYQHRDKWSVQLRKQGERYYYGTYVTIEEAAKVAELARQELFGRYAGKG